MVELAGTDRLLPACTTPIQEGMSIKTASAKLTQYRRMAVELLLVERNHVCSACVSNGHCELQSLARSLGITHVRYSYNNPRMTVDMTHPRFVLDQNRCILCTRCVRVCAEVEGAHVWEVASRGIYSRIVSDLKDDWGKASNCTGCGKCVQACPTGALAEKGLSVMEMVKQSDAVSPQVLLKSGRPPIRAPDPYCVSRAPTGAIVLPRISGFPIPSFVPTARAP
jgi:bidirectional [NiFe] hydrogenase diaphorase subunit